ncbi:MAG: hypothetical protein AAF960_16950 [Bacteroidota bacterium]
MKNFLLGLLGLFCLPLAAQRLPFNFDAKAIITLSDADMVSSAYIDGHLKTEPGVTDALTVIRWDSLVTQIDVQSLEVPNSVTNWVDGMDISNDGKVAFVIDTKKSLPRSIQQVSNVSEGLPDGNILYAIDIANLSQPKLIAHIQVGNNPLSVDVNPKNGHLLVINRENNNEINIIPWQNNQFGLIEILALNDPENVITHGNWHPNGQDFAVTIEPAMAVQFYRNTTDGIATNGDRLSLGGYIGAGQFSKNGQYYLIPDLQWNEGYDKQGALLSVKFSAVGQHQLVGRQAVGISPEGFALSPNGQLIAVSNMGTTFMPIDFPLFGQSASISLLQFDETNGQFQLLDTQSWDGVLPEGITFDEDGDMLAVTSFDYLDLTERKAAVSFWEIKNDSGKNYLQNTGFKLSVTRGCHYVKVTGVK